MSIKELVYNLENLLLTPEIRLSSNRLDELISDDFIEFGSSKKIFYKKDILDLLPNEESPIFTIETFEIKQLAENIILAFYTLKANNICSLRSSIWRQDAKGWKIIFHQGTK